MRIRKRVAFTLASVAAVAVGFIAFAASAAADPPACNPGTSATGDKANGGFAKTVTLLLDNDFAITPGTVPTCTTAQLSGKNISQAWATCGPGASAAHNAYLSPATAVSGRTSTAPPSNFNGCTMVFN